MAELNYGSKVDFATNSTFFKQRNTVETVFPADGVWVDVNIGLTVGSTGTKSRGFLQTAADTFTYMGVRQLNFVATIVMVLFKQPPTMASFKIRMVKNNLPFPEELEFTFDPDSQTRQRWMTMIIPGTAVTNDVMKVQILRSSGIEDVLIVEEVINFR